MGRAILIAIVVILIASAMVFVERNQVSSDVARVTTLQQTPPVAAVAASLPNTFNATGTLVFYPNNVGPVPYLYYTDRSGTTATKALTLLYGPPGGFSSWGGAHISVTGTVDQEHVVVSRIVYLSRP